MITTRGRLRSGRHRSACARFADTNPAQQERKRDYQQTLVQRKTYNSVQHESDSIPGLVRVACMWVSPTARLVLDRHLQLMSRSPRYHVAGINGTVVIDHNVVLIAIFDMHRYAVEVIAVLLKHKPVRAIFDHRIYGQDNLLLPDFDRTSNCMRWPTRYFQLINRASSPRTSSRMISLASSTKNDRVRELGSTELAT